MFSQMRERGEKTAGRVDLRWFDTSGSKTEQPAAKIHTDRAFILKKTRHGIKIKTEKCTV